MDENERLEPHDKERRDFLSCLGSAIACGAAAVAANSVASPATAATPGAPAAPEGGPATSVRARPRGPPRPAAAAAEPAIPGYDWSKHQWGFGVDAEKCIGCLRCVEACKKENNVALDPNHFRTW